MVRCADTENPMSPGPPPRLPNLHVLDWASIGDSLLADGYAHVPRLVHPASCRALRMLYDQRRYFRSRIVMAHHQFGQGEYAYFASPLPSLVSRLRTRLYARLAPVANGMMARMNRPRRYPATLGAFRQDCRRQGQTQPTPLLLRYRAGDFNCLHRDIYGPTHFPLQAMVMLSDPGKEFEGGDFVLVENRPRRQAKVTVLHPALGDLIVFPVHERPVRGKRGMLRASMRHGVSPLTTGERYVLGIIFHDAR